MAITPLPSAPLPTDTTAQFNTKAFAWVAALDSFTTEANALASAVDADATAAAADAASASSDAATAEAAADAAVLTANVELWVSGTTYAIGDNVYSPITFQTFRRKTNGAGSTDPSADSTNWQQLGGTGDVTTSGTQTLTNKTISYADNTLTGVVGLTATQTLTNKTLTTPIVTGIIETKTTSSANDFNLSNGNYFTHTVSGATTFTVSNTASTNSVSSFIIDLTNGGAATITWWSGMKWAGGTAPTLTASGRDALGFFTHDGGTTWTGLVLGKDIK